MSDGIFDDIEAEELIDLHARQQEDANWERDDWEKGVGADDLESLDLVALSKFAPSPIDFVVERIAPRGELTMFTGAGAAGKSLVWQQLATACAGGVNCLGLTIASGVAIYLTCEDDKRELHWRQHHICKALGLDMASLHGKLHLLSRRGELDNVLTAKAEKGKPTLSESYNRIARKIRNTGASLAILDHVAHMFDGNENDRGEVTQFINILNRLASETNAAIILIGHPNKAGDDYSGSTGWPNCVRSHSHIDVDPETGLRTIRLPKANYAKSGEVVSFRWFDHAFVREDDLPPDYAKELTESIKASRENEIFLSCLRQRTGQGEGRLVGPSSGPNYAPVQFEGMPEAKGLKRAALKRAMDRLYAIGAIESHTYRNRAKGRDVTIIREVPDHPRTPSRTAPEHTSRSSPNSPPERPRTHTHISKDISGGAHWPAPPDDELDWGEGQADA